MLRANLATTKTNLVAPIFHQYKLHHSYQDTTYLWPLTCHPEPPSKSPSILVLSPSKRAPSASFKACGKTRRHAVNHLVTSHVTITRIPASGAESRAGHIPSCGHRIKQWAPLLFEEDILQQCPDCMK